LSTGYVVRLALAKEVGLMVPSGRLSPMAGLGYHFPHGASPAAKPLARPIAMAMAAFDRPAQFAADF
jgi:hypothetical protein